MLTATSLLAARASAADIAFPSNDWEHASAESAGWDHQKLDAALDFAVSCKSSSVIVVHRGKIIAERHAPVSEASLRYRGMKRGETTDGHAIEDVASVQKSIVSVLVGIAVDRKLLSLDDPVQKHLGIGWSKADKDKEAAITIRHLVTMTSGLNTNLKFVADAGTRWAYNTNAYAKSQACLEAAAGKSTNELTSQWLTQKIGMTDSRWVERAGLANRGVDANRYGFATSGRDLARFGLLVLARGKWKDQVIVSQEYLESSLRPSQSLNQSYGFLWWLNGRSSATGGRRRANARLNPSAPPDLFAALGALGRKCYVVPSLDLVVVRLGDDPEVDGEEKFDRQFWRLIMSAKS